jgi:hypothetical protein
LKNPNLLILFISLRTYCFQRMPMVVLVPYIGQPYPIATRTTTLVVAVANGAVVVVVVEAVTFYRLDSNQAEFSNSTNFPVGLVACWAHLATMRYSTTSSPPDSTSPFFSISRFASSARPKRYTNDLACSSTETIQHSRNTSRLF